HRARGSPRPVGVLMPPPAPVIVRLSALSAPLRVTGPPARMMMAPAWLLPETSIEPVRAFCFWIATAPVVVIISMPPWSRGGVGRVPRPVMVAPGASTSDPAINPTEPEAMSRSPLAARETARVPKSSVQASPTLNALSMTQAPVAGQLGLSCRMMSAAVQAVRASAGRGRTRPAASRSRLARRSADPRWQDRTGKENVTGPLALLQAPCAEGQETPTDARLGRTPTPAVSIPASQKTVRQAGTAEKAFPVATFGPGDPARVCRNASQVLAFGVTSSPPG